MWHILSILRNSTLALAGMFLNGCAAYSLEPITYQEALSQYQQAGGIENYRCVFEPAGEDYRPLANTQPVAVEIDQVLFIKHAGAVHELQQQKIDGRNVVYALDDLSATLSSVLYFNRTEYAESEDRYVDLTFTAGGSSQSYKTFARACGL